MLGLAKTFFDVATINVPLNLQVILLPLPDIFNSGNQSWSLPESPYFMSKIFQPVIILNWSFGTNLHSR